MTSSTRADWLTPAGLIALSFIPALAGTFRIIELSSGAAITPGNARFFEAPLPVVLHIVSSVIYCILGAFQFSPKLRSLRPRLHRASGRVLIPCGLISASTGLWMAHFYPWVGFDGQSLYAMRLLVSAAMILFLFLGFAAILRRDITQHRAWMIRGYALALGAGTQVLTHLPWFLFPGIQGELSRTLFMGAGWAINIVIAEWLISRRRISHSNSASGA